MKHETVVKIGFSWIFCVLLISAATLSIVLFPVIGWVGQIVFAVIMIPIFALMMYDIWCVTE